MESWVENKISPILLAWDLYPGSFYSKERISICNWKKSQTQLLGEILLEHFYIYCVIDIRSYGERVKNRENYSAGQR